MDSSTHKQFGRLLRKRRTRAKIYGTPEIPRLCVSRSLQHTSAQVIDDSRGATLVSVTSRDLKVKGSKTDIAREVGKRIAELAKEKKITKVVFDRSGHKYHGRLKALADGAREQGLAF